jgi:hypothetical protein
MIVKSKRHQMKISFLMSVLLFFSAHKRSCRKNKRTRSRPTQNLLTSTGVQQNTATKTVTTANNVFTKPNGAKIDSAKASMTEASFSVTTARSYNEDPATNKAADTHWSCILYDQNGRQIASFQDNTNTE